MTGLQVLGLTAASLAAGLVNALAGGGSLLSFPALMGAGLPALLANVTNTVALIPGYLGASLGQWDDLKDQQWRLWVLLPAALAGGLTGAVLLLNTSERLFTTLMPWLILAGSALLAVQQPLKRWMKRSEAQASSAGIRWWTWPAVLIAGIYGGYFGAGLSVIVLAVLAIGLDDTLNRLSGLKQALALSANVTAALVFLALGEVNWSAAGLMAGGSLLGGYIGGRIAGWVKPQLLQQLVVGAGFAIGGVYLWRSVQT